jgi:rRNA biogenesis protein RRP5
MGSVKRKEGPGGLSVSKSAKSTAESRPTKRAKSDDEGQKPAQQAASLVSRLKEEEPMFPRGGGSILTPLEHKQIQIQARNDALFEQEKGASGAKHEKAARKQKKNPAPKEVKPNADAVKIESLNFKVRFLARSWEMFPLMCCSGS